MTTVGSSMMATVMPYFGGRSGPDEGEIDLVVLQARSALLHVLHMHDVELDVLLLLPERAREGDEGPGHGFVRSRARRW